MKAALVNFLTDGYLEEVAQKLCNKKLEHFVYLIDHKKPNSNSSLSKLRFLDATLLYNQNNFERCFANYNKISFDYDECSELQEGANMVLRTLDRITPIPLSNLENELYFWQLASYFKGFIKQNKNLEIFIFDNIPHLPWDLTLFYVAKLMKKKTLILRRTNIGGYAYISEDFRPNLLNYKFDYSNNNPDIFKNLITISDKINFLKQSDFAKDQIDGIWPEEFKKRKKLKKIFNNRLINYFSTFYSLINKPKAQNLGATEKLQLNSTLSRQREINNFQFFKLKKNYKKKLKELLKIDREYSKSLKNLENLKYIFFPLHFQPERSTLPEGVHFDKQNMAIQLLSEHIPENLKIIVKDHPKQYYSDLRNYFYRDKNYLKNLEKIKNVIVVSSNHNYENLFKNSLLTATISGSISWRSLIEGIPTITFSDTWLSDCESTKLIVNSKHIKNDIEYLLKKNKLDVQNDVIDFIEKNQRYFLETVVYSKHLRFFKNQKEKPIEVLTKSILERI